MREILFRGKRKSDGQWVHGCLVRLGKESFSDADRYGIIDICVPLGGTTVCYNFKVNEVIPETVGQYTGIIDSDNNKLFEGDIISIPFEEDRSPYEPNGVYYENALVYFDDSRHGWYVRFTDCDELSLWEYDESDVLVIGNVHDNPDLFEEKAAVYEEVCKPDDKYKS